MWMAVYEHPVLTTSIGSWHRFCGKRYVNMNSQSTTILYDYLGLIWTQGLKCVPAWAGIGFLKGSFGLKLSSNGSMKGWIRLWAAKLKLWCNLFTPFNRMYQATLSNSWFATTWQGGHVKGQYNRIFFWRIYLKIELSYQRREMLLFLTTNMAAVTSRANQQYGPIIHLPTVHS